MIKFEIVISSYGPRSPWDWSIIRHDTVAGTDEIVEEASEPTSGRAVSKAKVALLTAVAKHTEHEDHS